MSRNISATHLKDETRFSPTKFASICIANSKQVQHHKDMQTFRSYGLTEELAKERILFELGTYSIYGVKTTNKDKPSRSTFDGAIELIGRYPKIEDGFYFKYISHNKDDEMITIYSSEHSFECEAWCECVLIYTKENNA